MKEYYCVICGVWFDGEPHTDPSTGEDCHEKCCPVCHPRLGPFRKSGTTRTEAPLDDLPLFAQVTE